MKKSIFLLMSIFLFSSCLDDDSSLDAPNINFELLPIDEFVAPESFTFGQKATIKIKYTLKSECYYFDGIQEEIQEDGSIVLAVRTVVDLDALCANDVTQQDYNYIINVNQKEDYIFKFYRGLNTNSNTVLEEVVIPVN